MTLMPGSLMLMRTASKKLTNTVGTTPIAIRYAVLTIEFMARGSCGMARKFAKPTKRGADTRSQLNKLSPKAIIIGAITKVVNSTMLGARKIVSQAQYSRVPLWLARGVKTLGFNSVAADTPAEVLFLMDLT